MRAARGLLPDSTVGAKLHRVVVGIIRRCSCAWHEHTFLKVSCDLPGEPHHQRTPPRECVRGLNAPDLS
eukprot:12527456-Alexandrium_andersonii.AAC.2